MSIDIGPCCIADNCGCDDGFDFIAGLDCERSRFELGLALAYPQHTCGGEKMTASNSRLANEFSRARLGGVVLPMDSSHGA